MKNLGEVKVIVGVKIIGNENCIILSQEHYVEKILRKFKRFDESTLSTPYDPNVHLKNNRREPITQSKYAHIIRSLLHLMNYNKLDITCDACRLRRYTHCPSSEI